MANYINVGAVNRDGDEFKTKKAFKEAFQADPANVLFFSTSSLSRSFNGCGNDIPDDVILSVCGPNPYLARNWYATVNESKKGQVK